MPRYPQKFTFEQMLEAAKQAGWINDPDVSPPSAFTAYLARGNFRLSIGMTYVRYYTFDSSGGQVMLHMWRTPRRDWTFDEWKAAIA